MTRTVPFSTSPARPGVGHDRVQLWATSPLPAWMRAATGERPVPVVVQPEAWRGADGVWTNDRGPCGPRFGDEFGPFDVGDGVFGIVTPDADGHPSVRIDPARWRRWHDHLFGYGLRAVTATPGVSFDAAAAAGGVARALGGQA